MMTKIELIVMRIIRILLIIVLLFELFSCTENNYYIIFTEQPTIDIAVIPYDSIDEYKYFDLDKSNDFSQ